MAEAGAPKLTPKQRLFVEYYCGADDGVSLLNATQSYIRAGYSPKNAHRDSSTLIRQNPAIRAQIEELFAEKALSRNQVLALVAADASRTDSDIRDGANQYSSDIVQSSFVSGHMSARSQARANLMKAHGVFTENINVTGGIDINIVGVDTEKI